MKQCVIFSIIMVLFYCSCDKWLVRIDSDQKKIQGKWQLVNADSIYYNFQNQLFQYQNYFEKDSILSVYGYYKLHSHMEIELYLICYQSFINTWVVNTKPLNQFLNWEIKSGETQVDTMYRKFQIEFPKKNQMKMTHLSEELLFQKF